MIGKYPSCVLHLTMPYETVDVNVHPNKLEVRFQNEAAVSEAIEAIVRDAIQDRDALEHPTPLLLTKEEPASPVRVTKQTVDANGQGSVPAPRNRPEVGYSAKTAPVSPSATFRELSPMPFYSTPKAPTLREDPVAFPVMRTVPVVPMPSEPPPVPIRQPRAPEKKPEPEQVASFLPEAQKPIRLIGVAFNTFILVEYEDNLLLIDQHAVHERLLFDRYMQAVDQQRCGQELLIPMLVTVTRREQLLLTEHHELLESIGLTVEPFGDTEVSIRTIPMILGEPQTQDFLHEIIEQLENERGSISLEKRRASILQMACKKAVKGGDPLSEAEIRDLVTRMIDEKVTPTCPHGRPLVIALSHRELDKRFKRIQ